MTEPSDGPTSVPERSPSDLEVSANNRAVHRDKLITAAEGEIRRLEGLFNQLCQLAPDGFLDETEVTEFRNADGSLRRKRITYKRRSAVSDIVQVSRAMRDWAHSAAALHGLFHRGAEEDRLTSVEIVLPQNFYTDPADAP